MKSSLDALWRALAYCLLPRVIWLSVLPLVLCVGATGLLGYFFWGDGVTLTNDLLHRWSLAQTLLDGLDALGLSSLRGMVAPLVLVAAAVPVVVVVCLLTVAQVMVPSLVRLVRVRRFPDLQSQGDESWVWGVLRSIGWTLLAGAVLLLSLPLWLIPPFAAIVPPLIWGWLSYRVMTGDVLAEVASSGERAALLRAHRGPLWAIGIVTGYLGATPSLLWAFGATSLMLAPLVIIASVWLYTGIFVFSALWFAHYALKALHTLRTGSEAEVASAPDSTQLSLPGMTQLGHGDPS
ncbi:EI24 domain-containing protein [Aquabacterium sp.]|uniref:EI24 domain-containing protein n=1 Tax=Aquabacterium sp. TaxID=1872578 RepID=UPI0035B3A079